MSIGAGIGGLYAGITHVAYYVAGATNFLMVLGYVGGGTANLVNGVISCVIALVGAAIATYIIGLEPKKQA
jgi:PTS system beta-glucosides-specific IIC component